ncbi:type B chloramphenicol O-acetyltransferase [Vibrio parahaemolyticus]
MNYFESPFSGIPLCEQVTNPNIIVGKHSYYSGYYHSHSFDDCARYLNPERDDVDKLIIGSYCSIGSGAVFMMAGNQGHRSEWVSTFPFFYQDNEYFIDAEDGFHRAGDTIVGNDVWVGSEAMIMSGVKVGHGAIIASRAVVTKDVAPYEVVGSNPAKHIKYRFSEPQIAMLLEMKWWDWPESKLKGCMKQLCSSDIEGLYEYWQSEVRT